MRSRVIRLVCGCPRLFGRLRIPLLLLPLPLDLGDLTHQVPDLIAIEFSDRGNAVDVLDEVFGCAKEGFERRFAIAATEKMANPA